MSTTYKITVINNSPNPQEFYFFQEPASYSGGSKVYTNSIANRGLPAYISGRTSQIQFTLSQQYYAGIQQKVNPITLGQAQTSIVSQVAIDLASEGQENKDTTTVNVNDSTLYLNLPTFSGGVQDGAFRITTPPYNPMEYEFLAGLSTKTNTGDIVLSNFILAEPNKNIDVQPVVKFYVATGSYVPGTVVNFSTSSQIAALCDATSGKDSFIVTYNEDGTWNVK